jgi:hypothetical protein
MSALLRHRGWIIATSLLVTAIVVVDHVLKPRTYTAQAVFMPQGAQGAVGHLGIASQLGLNLPGRRQHAVAAVLRRPRALAQHPRRGDRHDVRGARRARRGARAARALLVPKGDGGPLHREKALEKLRASTIATAGQKTGSWRCPSRPRRPTSRSRSSRA